MVWTAWGRWLGAAGILLTLGAPSAQAQVKAWPDQQPQAQPQQQAMARRQPSGSVRRGTANGHATSADERQSAARAWVCLVAEVSVVVVWAARRVKIRAWPNSPSCAVMWKTPAKLQKPSTTAKARARNFARPSPTCSRTGEMGQIHLRQRQELRHSAGYHHPAQGRRHQPEQDENQYLQRRRRRGEARPRRPA